MMNYKIFFAGFFLFLMSSCKATLQDSEKIRVENPMSNQQIKFPLLITGKARGTWFFEANFPVYLLDENHQKLATGIAVAKGNWMTEGWVGFEVEFIFEKPQNELKGFLRFEKSNPTNKSKFDDAIEIPIKF